MRENEAWKPPTNPNPNDILHEGVDDTRGARYQVALEKFVWFYENALTYEPALSAVRLSFGLSYWYDLANEYAPALAALREARDRAESDFERSGYKFRHFQELATINRTLGEGLRTASIFKQLCTIDREAARRVYHVAETFLIEAGEYAACGPFLDPEQRLEIASDGYRLAQQFDRGPVSFARMQFVQNAATLVALLVLDGRESEAKSANQKALQTLDDPQFRTVLDAAMTGHLPARPFN